MRSAAIFVLFVQVLQSREWSFLNFQSFLLGIKFLFFMAQSKRGNCCRKFKKFTCAHSLVFENDAIIDEPDVLRRVLRLRPFSSEQVDDFCGKHSVFTILQ